MSNKNSQRVTVVNPNLTGLQAKRKNLQHAGTVFVDHEAAYQFQIDKLEENHDKDYVEKYKLLHDYAPCEYKMAELVEQLDAEENYEKLLQSQGLKVLRSNRLLSENAQHKKLMQKLVAFNQYWKQWQEQLTQLEKQKMEMTKDQVKKNDKLKKKRAVFDGLKNLLQKLSYSPEGQLQLQQLDRILLWLDQKLEQIEEINPELRRQQEQVMTNYLKSKGKLEINMDIGAPKPSLPGLKCQCGEIHYEDRQQIKPMGTLNLKKVIEQSQINQKLNNGIRTNKSVLLLGKNNQNKFSSPMKQEYSSIQDRYHSKTSQRQIPKSSYRIQGYPAEVDNLMNKLRNNSLEMVRHEATVTLAHLEQGRSKSKAETYHLEKQDRINLASNFQDTGIKKRMKQYPPNYRSKEEFLNLAETSDEDGPYHLENIKEIEDESDYNKGAYTNNDTKEKKNGKSAKVLQPAQYHNFESTDIIVKLQSQLNLPIEEEPEIVQNYMHKRMANQAQHSLNQPKLSNFLEQEAKRQKIAKLRRFHKDLLGVKVSDKNTSHNGIKINGPSLDEKPKKKLETDEADLAQSSDDEILNAVNQYADSVTLSVYDDKNLAKKKFQNKYYSTMSTKRDLAQSRVTMMEEKRSSVKVSPEKLIKLNRAFQPEPFGTPMKPNSYGMKLVAQVGNISGLHVEEEDVKFLKLPKTAQLASLKQLYIVDAELQATIDKEEELKQKLLSKSKTKGKKKDDKKKPEEEEEPDIRPKGDPYLLGQLNELIRSEKFESRMQDMQEVDQIQRHLFKKNIYISSDSLQRSVLMPEDELPPLQASGTTRIERYPLIEKGLIVDPFKVVKKTKKKK